MAQKRLVIENDDVVYRVSDCLEVHCQIGTPVVFDNLRYQINPDEIPMIEALKKCLQTWQGQPVLPGIHYSNQASGKARRPFRHNKPRQIPSFPEKSNLLFANILSNNYTICYYNIK